MRPATLVFIVTLLATTSLHAQPQPPATRSRKDFAAARSRLKDGMTTTEVEAILGKPDDVVDDKDDVNWIWAGTREAWRYGTSGHLTPATLGYVFIDDNGQAQYIRDKGPPKTDESFDESELRRILTLIGEVPSYRSATAFDPLTVVRAVNALQPLGKERAFSVMNEYLRTACFNENDGAFLVMRSLFEVPSPPGHMPRMHVGMASEEPEEKNLAPRFPIFIQDDIPFLITRGYYLGGRAEEPTTHIEHFRNHEIRPRPLQPSLAPFTSLKSLVQSVTWLENHEKEDLAELLEEQAMKMLDSVYRPEPGPDNERLPYDNDPLRNRLITEASQLKLRWDASQNIYTQTDGKSLPPRTPIHYRDHTWQPDIPGTEIRVSLRRTNTNWVRVNLGETRVFGKPHPKVTMKVSPNGDSEKTLVHIEGAGARGELFGTSSSGSSLRLPEGEAVQISLEIADRKLTSPIFKP